MNEFLNVWMDFKYYEALKNHLQVPTIFAFIKDGKPSLEMHNPGQRPNYEIDQVMFLKLPLIKVPQSKNNDPHVQLEVEGDQVKKVVTEEVDNVGEENRDS